DEAEAREVALGGGGEEVERADVPRLRLCDDALDQRAPETLVAIAGAHGRRAKERMLATQFETDDANDPLATFRDDEAAQRLFHVLGWQAARLEQSFDARQVLRARSAKYDAGR